MAWNTSLGSQPNSGNAAELRAHGVDHFRQEIAERAADLAEPRPDGRSAVGQRVDALEAVRAVQKAVVMPLPRMAFPPC
jgi:hypothetical protein